MPSSSVSTDTPSQRVPSLDHFVTQWMSTVGVSAGRSRNSSHVQRAATDPVSSTIVKSHSSSGVNGVGPADNTGKVVDDVLARRDQPGTGLPASTLEAPANDAHLSLLSTGPTRAAIWF